MVASPVRSKIERDAIDEELANVLELYCDELQEQIAAIPSYRQKIIAYVLDRIERSRQHSPLTAKLSSRSLEFRLQVERYIHEGIARILQVNLATLDRYIPRNYCVSSSQSQWFS